MISPNIKQTKLGGGFNYVLCSSLLEEDSQFDEHILQIGGKKPPTTLGPQKPMEKWRFWTRKKKGYNP